MLTDKQRDELVAYVKLYAPVSLPGAGGHPTMIHDMMLTPEQSQFVQHAIEAWAIVEQLRADEGNSVEIVHDNPDFGWGPACCVIDTSAFTREQRYYGDTVLQALRAALEARGVA